MSDLFLIYEDKFNDLVNKIQEIIISFSTLSRDKAEFALSSSVELFKETEGILHKMEIETSSNGTLVSLNKVKQYKSEFNTLQNNFQIIKDKYITQKAESAIMLNTEDNEILNMKQKGEGLIANENGNDDIKFDSVDISNSYDHKKMDIIQEKKREGFEIQDSNQFNFQSDKKRKKFLILMSIMIIIALVFLIILLSFIL